MDEPRGDEGALEGARLGATQSAPATQLAGTGAITVVHLPVDGDLPGPGAHVSTGLARTNITGRNPKS